MRQNFIVFLFSTMAMFLGCNSLRAFPLQSEVYTKHYDEVQLFDESKWINNPYYKDSEKHRKIEAKKGQIEEYYRKNPDANIKNLEAMRAFKLAKGMNKEEVEIIAGKPSQKHRNKLGHEVWFYRKWPDMFAWYYKWGKLEFEDNVLIDIEAQHVDIEK